MLKIAPKREGLPHFGHIDVVFLDLVAVGGDSVTS